MTLEISTITTPFIFNATVNCYPVRVGNNFVLIDTGMTNKRDVIFFESEVEVPRIRVGNKQTIEKLIAEECLFFGKIS